MPGSTRAGGGTVNVPSAAVVRAEPAAAILGASCTSRPRPCPVPCTNCGPSPRVSVPAEPPRRSRLVRRRAERLRSLRPEPPAPRRTRDEPRRRVLPSRSCASYRRSIRERRPKSMTTRSPADSRRSPARACGRAEVGPEATMVSKAGRSKPVRRIPASSACATSTSRRPTRMSLNTPAATADRRAPASRSVCCSHASLMIRADSTIPSV